MLDNLADNGGNMRKAILDAGYSQEVADNPQKITESRTWNELIAAEMPDDAVSDRHNQLLRASKLEQRVFPEGVKLTANKVPGSDELSDEEIIEMFKASDCEVLRVVHQLKPAQRIVYYISPDNLIRDKALDKVYKIKGKYADEGQGAQRPTGNVYNFIFSAETQEKVKIIEGEIKNALIKKPNAS